MQLRWKSASCISILPSSGCHHHIYAYVVISCNSEPWVVIISEDCINFFSLVTKDGHGSLAQQTMCFAEGWDKAAGKSTNTPSNGITVASTLNIY